MPTIRTQRIKIVVGLLVLGALVYGGYLLYSNSTGALFSRASQALENRNLDLAKQTLQRILSRNPNHLDALLMLAGIIFDEKNYPQAEVNLKKILSLEPDNLEALRMLAKIHLYQGRFQEAHEEYRRIASLTSTLDAGDRAGDALALAGLAVGATNSKVLLADVEKLLIESGPQVANQPEAQLAQSLIDLDAGNYEAAMEKVNQAKRVLGNLFPVMWVLGKTRFYSGDIDGSLSALEMADQIKASGKGVAPPPHWTMELYLHEGLCRIEQGQLDEAVRRLNIALENEPTAVEPTLAMVNLHLIQAFTESARPNGDERDVSRLYRLASDALARRKDILSSAPAHRYQYALIELYLQNHREALQTLESLASEEPPYLQSLHELGDLYTSQANYAKAAAVYRKILSYAPDDHVTRYNLGTVLIRNHDIEAAREQLELVVEAKPDWLDARLNHGLASRLGQRFREAEDDYKAILEKSPDNMDALIGQGLIAWTRGDSKTAGEFFNRVREIHQDRSEPYYYLGQLALEEGRDAEARSMFERCLSLNPQNEFAALAMVEIEFRRRSWAPARERLQTILDNPDARLKVVANNALALAEVMEGDLEKARERLAGLEQIVSGLEPELVAAVRTNQALLAVEEKRFDDAVQFARTATDFLPREVTTHYNLGTVQLLAGKFSEAILSFRKALELDPKHEASQYNLAAAQASLNQWSETQKILSRLAEKEDAPIEVIRNLGEAYVAGDQPDEALDILEKGLAKQPDAMDLQILKAKSLIALGEVKEARKIAENLVKSYPQEWQAQMVGGIAAFLDGDAVGGETLLRKAYQLNPEDPAVKLNLATLLVAKREYRGLEEAETLLNELENAGERSPAIYNQHALLAFHQSDFATAREYLQKSLQLKQDQPKVEALFKQIQEL